MAFALMLALLMVGGAAAEATAEAAAEATAAVPAEASPLQGNCFFEAMPQLPYYWEPSCTKDTPGCWADSAHMQCRFCGFPGVPCPAAAVVAVDQPAAKASTAAPAFLAASSQPACTFANPPKTPYYWEPQCRMGMVGCNADDQHVQCRFCGTGAYSGIPCEASLCVVPNEPRTPYYWDPDCKMGMFGCMADGHNAQCRFCVKKPFDSIKCPASLEVPQGSCLFPGQAPSVPHYWEPSCEFGMLGCWADGIHSECRFCGVGAYKAVACPP